MTTEEELNTQTQAGETISLGKRLPVQALWLTSMVSIFGNQLTALAVPWFVLETTGSASKTAITAAVTIIPTIIASFFGGALVDRVSYRAMSVISDLLSALTVAAVPILYLTVGLNFPTLLVLMFLGSLLDAPGGTARTAMVPPISRLTGIPLERINANFGMIAAASALFSAPLAGVLIAWLGAVNVLWFNVGTFIVSMLLIALLVPRLERMEMSGASFMGDVLAGLAYVRNQDFVRTLILGALGINFLFAPLFGIAIPWFANQELQSVRSLGIMLGGQGLGALAGAYLYGRLAATVRRRTLLVTSLTLLSVPLFPLAFVSSVWPATALLILIGLASGMVNPMIMTFVQRTTPGAYLGRVMGLINAGAMVAQPLGLVLGGMFLGLVGFSPVVFAIAVLVTTVSVVLLQSHALRQLDNPIPVEAPATTG